MISTPAAEAHASGTKAPDTGAALRELRWAAPLILSLIAVQMVWLDSAYLYVRKLWMDEVFTMEFAQADSLSTAMRSITSGMDRHPPAAHLIYRFMLRLLLSGHPEVMLRVCTSFFIAMALFGVFVLVRQRYSRLVAITATMTMWAHPVIIFTAFDGRGYVMWIAYVAWLCVAIDHALRAPSPKRASLIAMGVLSFLIATTHHLGVVSIGVVVAPYLLLFPLRSLKKIWPVAFGLVGFIACIPLMKMQAHVSTESNWMPLLRGIDPAMAFLATVCPLAAALFVVPWGADYVCRVLGRKAELRDDSTVGMSALVLFPFFLMAVSTFYMGMTLARYATPCFIVMAPAAAALLAPQSRVRQLVFFGLVFWLGAAMMRWSSWDRRADMDAGHGGRIIDAEWAPVPSMMRETLNAGMPLVLEDSVMSYVLLYEARDIAPKVIVTYPMAQNGEQDADERRAQRYVADMMVAHSKTYGYPIVEDWASLTKRVSHFYFVPGKEAEHPRPDGTTKIAELKGCTSRFIKKHLFEMTCAPQ